SFQGTEILSGSAPVEFGHSRGGTVNAVTRSGSQQFHGSLYGYFSNQNLTATDRYALGEKLFGKRYQTGASLGGPVRQGKLFFFANAELLDSSSQGLNRITSPLLADTTGTKVQTSNCTATAAQCFVAANYVVQPQMNVVVPQSDHWVTGLGKLD